MFNFNVEYNRNNFVSFLSKDFLPEDFNSKEENISLDFASKHATTAVRLGKCPSLDLEVFEITHSSTHDARVGISSDAFQLLLRKSYCNRALVAFIPVGSKNYRFSLLQIEAEQKEHSSRITRNYSNPRRYSYFLGEDAHTKTPEQFLREKGRIKPKDGDYFKDLLDRFSVEVLTKQFYSELFNWYQWTLSDNDGFEVTFPNDTSTETDDRKIEEHIIRLITRLMFVWFVKQKKLIPESIFNISELGDVLVNFDSKSKKSGNYYNAILQNLFFATLNKPIKERKFASEVSSSFQGKNEHYGIKTMFRNANEGSWFKQTNERIIELFNSVPFLNGGLFECLDKTDEKGKVFYYDGFSRAKGTQKRAFIPNCLFFDPERGLIPLLQKYNFTVEENTPNDIEVALDPELLGKVFENLLGAYNPETKETARKQSGSFYTPREIVNYMVNESLIAYLVSACQEVDESIFRDLVTSETLPNEIKEDKHISKRIAEKLKAAKILDPACGSGAYPMGILNRMLDVLKKLDTEHEHTIYDLKLNLIENCIFGIDIQTIAVQISKLRFFISLICEQEKDNSKENFGIIALPNLETKFVAANSLFGLKQDFSDKLDFQIKELQSLKNQLWDVRHKHFLASNATEKHKLRKEDERLRTAIKNFLVDGSSKPNEDKIYRCQTEIEKLQSERKQFETEKWKDVTEQPRQQVVLDFGFEPEHQVQQSIFRVDVNKQMRIDIDAAIKRLENDLLREQNKTKNSGFEEEADKLAHWDPYNQNESSSFFDAEWMFGLQKDETDTGFFDVVIGNPPYVEAKKLKDIASKLKNYVVATGTSDLSVYFIENGINLCKSNGSIYYITTNKFFNTGYGKPVRKLLIEYQINNIIEFEQVEVFDNVLVSSVILGIKKSDKIIPNFTYQKFYKLKKVEFTNQFVEKQSAFGMYEQIKLTESEWSFSDNTGLALKQRIENVGKKISDIKGVAVFRGVTTGYNPAFIIDTDKKNELIAIDKKNEQIIKPLLQGRNIRKWIYNYNNENLIFTKQSIAIDKYPLIKTYLYDFYTELKPRESDDEKSGRKPGSYQWYEIQDNTAYYPEFEKAEKIIWGLTADKWAFAYDDKQHYLPSNGYILTSDNIPIKYLLALLNSNTLKYYFGFIGVMTAGGAYTLKHATIQQLPVAIAKIQQPIINLVDYILLLYNFGENTPINNYVPNSHLIQLFEEVINALVYELYFEDDFKKNGIEFMQYAMRDFNSIKGKPEIEAKMLIHSAYQKLRESDNEIRNNLKLMDIKLTDLIMPIKNAKR